MRALWGCFRALLRPGRVTYGVLVLLLAALFHSGATEHGAEINTSAKAKDQGAYLNLARRMAESREIEVDGARPPLYPALIAPVYRASSSTEDFFEAAKRQSVNAVWVSWLIMLMALRYWLKPWTALVAWAAIGFPLLMFYAPYVKGEALFYVFSTCAFACMLEVLHRPRLKFAALTGVVIGVAQLSKESMLPALGLFVAVQGLTALVRLGTGLRREGRNLRKRALLRRALSVPVVVIAFLITVYPHIRVNKRVFGHHFYNVNSYFYIWYDSWGAVVKGTRAHGDRQGWPDMPKDELPSAKAYWQSHSIEQIQKRIERGARGIMTRSLSSHGFLDYAGFGLFVSCAALGVNTRLRKFVRQNWQLVLFSVGYLVGYFLMCTWFYAIHPGVRFVAALSPPLILLGAWLSDRARSSQASGLFALFTLIGAASLAVDIPKALLHTITTMKNAGW